jgi:hypothetical protein
MLALALPSSTLTYSKLMPRQSFAALRERIKRFRDTFCEAAGRLAGLSG